MKKVMLILMSTFVLGGCNPKNSSGKHHSKSPSPTQISEVEVVLPEPIIEFNDLEIPIQDSRRRRIGRRPILDSQKSFQSMTNEQMDIEKIIFSHFIKSINTNRRIKLARIRGFLDLISSESVEGLNNHQIKGLIEDLVLRNHSNISEIKYNQTYKSIFDVLQYGKLQCYSGTMLYLLSKKWLPTNLSVKDVVIFESGHILPGYMVWNKNHWELVGIEMTAAGYSQINYGDTKKLNQAIRIVHSIDYIKYEARKSDLISPNDIVDKMLKRASLNFQIPIDRTEEKVLSYIQSTGVDSLNSSHFAFGIAKDIPGDKERSVIDIETRFQVPIVEEESIPTGHYNDLFDHQVVSRYPISIIDPSYYAEVGLNPHENGANILFRLSGNSIFLILSMQTQPMIFGSFDESFYDLQPNGPIFIRETNLPGCRALIDKELNTISSQTLCGRSLYGIIQLFDHPIVNGRYGDTFNSIILRGI